MKLSVVFQVMPSAGLDEATVRAGIPDIAEETRTAWIKTMQQHLEQGDVVEADLDIVEGHLHMSAQRFGKAFAAVWTVDEELMGASAFLFGRDGKDDSAAMKFLKDHPLVNLSDENVNHMLAKERPMLCTFYYAGEWFTNGGLELAATALTLATMAGPNASPKMEMEKPMTPEEEEASRKSAEKISDAFGIIYNDWVTRKRLMYTVIPSEPIKDRPVSEIMHVTFMVGAGNNLIELNIQELTAAFMMLKDQTEQLKGSKHLKNMTINTTIKIKHDTPIIAAVLKQLTIDEPGDLKFDFTQERFQHVAEMVGKKAEVAVSGFKGNHFRVYPPQEFLDRPEVINEPDIFDKLKDTSWWVRWYDNRYDQLSFGEFLGFIDQIIEVQRSFAAAAHKAKQEHEKKLKNAGGWHPKKDRTKKPKPKAEPMKFEVNTGLNVRALIRDGNIRFLFGQTALEKSTCPPEARN